MIMKKTLIVIALILSVTCQNLIAQKKGFHIGIKGGVNFGMINGSSFQGNFDYNYLLGGLIQIPIVHKVSIQPEVLFSQSTSEASNNLSQPFDPNNPNNQNIKLDYLNIPVLLNLGGAFKLQVGPQYSILINKNNTLLANGQSAFKSGNFSMCAGFQWRTPILGLHLGARYVIGLSDINDVANQSNWKYQALQVSTGFIF
jgi:hypothetical protein